MDRFVVFLVVAFVGCLASAAEANRTRFPDYFRFGAATASYQVEGAWNLSGKGEHVWDRFTHEQPHKIKDRSNGDIACNSYNNYKRDVEMLSELGVHYYRFSIAWSRILPDGYVHNVNQEGIDYYNRLIDELIAHDIQPMVTLFHWDTPQPLQDMGGWTNPLIVDRFEEYSRVAFTHFGDRVRDWITFNEPMNLCLLGYGARTGFLVLAPDINGHGTAEYQCAHNVLKANARTYHMYAKEFKAMQHGKMSMASINLWAEPEKDTTEDEFIREKGMQFTMGWFCHPIFTKEGDYPAIMRQEIDAMSAKQGYKESRLPKFTPEEVEYIKGTSDYMGMNYYTTVVYHRGDSRPDKSVPSHENDLGHYYYQKEEWPGGASAWLKLRPKGLRDALNWVAKEYGNPEVYITENGYSSRGGLNDVDRVDFINTHLQQVLKAIEDGCNVTAYTAWSLMDNFEWVNGYTELFGLYQVDFSDPNRTRTPRMSALTYKRIIKTRAVDPTYLPFINEDEPGLKPDNIKLILLIFFLVVILIVLSAIANWMCKRRVFALCKKNLRSNAYGGSQMKI